MEGVQSTVSEVLLPGFQLRLYQLLAVVSGGWKGGVGALRRVEDGGSAAKARNLRSYRIGGL